MPLDHAKIKIAIAKLQVSQAEIARRSGMSPPALNRILVGGRIDPIYSTAQRIAAALKCELAEISVDP